VQDRQKKKRRKEAQEAQRGPAAAFERRNRQGKVRGQGRLPYGRGRVRSNFLGKR
jgi:hypothetical protein